MSNKKVSVSDITKTAIKGFWYYQGIGLVGKIDRNLSTPPQQQQVQQNNSANYNQQIVERIRAARQRQKNYMEKISEGFMCGNCGADTTPDDKYCRECGVILFAECEKCGAKVKHTDTFCPGCRMPVEEMTIECPEPITNESIEARKKKIAEETRIPTYYPAGTDVRQKKKSDPWPWIIATIVVVVPIILVICFFASIL